MLYHSHRKGTALSIMQSRHELDGSKLFIISVVIHEKSGYLLCQAHIINAIEYNNYWHKFSPLVNDKYALCVDLSKYQSL